jgi:hypothetical protein
MSQKLELFPAPTLICGKFYFTVQFVSPSGISDLCGTIAWIVTPKGSLSIGRESLQLFCVLGAEAYLQFSPLGGSRDETWCGKGIRKRSVSWNLPKLSQL